MFETNYSYMLDKYEKVIKEFLDFYNDIPYDKPTTNPTYININFSDNNEFEPYLLQGDYDYDASMYWIAVHPLNSHFINDNIYVKNWIRFKRVFLKLIEKIIIKYDCPKTIEIIFNGVIMKRYVWMC